MASKRTRKNKSIPFEGSVGEYLAALKASPRFGHQVVHHQEFAGKRARFGKPEKPWPPELVAALRRMGVEKLYAHQATAIDSIRRGEDVVVATPTASGKSLIYNLPVFESIMADRQTRALYLFPLKALAQDQLRSMRLLAEGLPEEKRPSMAICDGDTSAYKRKKLREAPPDILISNPDMLHLSLLGYHASWAGFWAGVKFVVLDEVHTYRGVFGSHMAWVLRRLRRVCRLYGSEPLFLLFSATVGNPAELARDLLGKDVRAVTATGAPQGGRHFVFVDPLDSASYAAGQFLEAAVKRGLRTIVYTQSRKITELVALWTQARLGPLRDKLTAYRAGFLPEERREIEQKLATGELLGVVSTSALELGIDIGELDICILVGYPGTIMATWQRSGRVGRRQRESLTILIGQEDALDQYFMRNPTDFFDRDIEAAVLNPANRVIMERHLVCAAAERPIAVDDPLLDGPAEYAVSEMADSGALLLGADGREWFTNRKYPHRQVDIRGGGLSFVIRAAGYREPLGEIDGHRCLKECHPGAVYLHRGNTWLVTHLDLNGHEVTVRKKKTNYFTRTLGSKETEILKIYESLDFAYFKVSFGYLRVTDTVTGFQRRLVSGQRLLSTESLDLPPLIFETEGLWIEIPKNLQAAIEREKLHFMGGIHALEHAAIGVFPLLVLCDRNDIGGIAYPLHPQLSHAAVFIYDGQPGGTGLSRQAFGRVAELLRITENTIRSCSCEVGCPSCVHSPKCGSGNRPIDKEAARIVLEHLLSKGEDGQPVEPVAVAVTTRVSQGAAPGNNGHARPVPKEIKKKTVVEPFQGMVLSDECRVGAASGIASAPADREADEGGRDLPPGNYCVFDVETKRSAADVGGWHRAELMGVSVAVLYDAQHDRYRAFSENEMPEFVEFLQRFDLVVGFNNKRFDNRVLSAYTSFRLHALPTLDILEEVKKRLGYRLSLDSLAEYTLGVKKMADGLMALKWYKEGKLEKIIEYCRKDVEITRDLFLFGVRKRYLLFKNKAEKVVRCPVRFIK